MTTEAEKRVIQHLVNAWNEFRSLDEKHPDDMDEFRYSIHALQNIIAWRVARRADPETWGFGPIPGAPED